MNRNIEFLIIGLTGPIGSGCTTIANIMSRLKPNKLIKKKNLYEKTLNEIKEISTLMKNEKDNFKLESLNAKLQEKFRYKILLKEIEKFNDPNFTYISMSSIIIRLAIKYIDTREFNDWEKNNSEIASVLKEFRDKWKEILLMYDNSNEKHFDELNSEKLMEIDDMLEALELVKKEIKNIELELYFDEKIDEFHLQAFGDNIRRNGNPFNNDEKKSKSEIYSNVLDLPNELRKIIKFYRHRNDGNKSSCFIVDAFRNPIEVEYFRKRYSQFFLVSIFADYKQRFNRLKKDFSELDSDKFNELFLKMDDRDYGADVGINNPFIQNVSRCCYLSDIAINNQINSQEINEILIEKFLKYYALMMSPGCVQPTKEETYMDLAYTLSLRSTCISRKVGAVITDKDNFVLGLGWNDVARSQIGCSLRLKEDLVEFKNDFYSLDLVGDEIKQDDLKDIKESDAFCFKDILSKSKIRSKLKKSKLSSEAQDEVANVLKIKRLEYCRALHAEENALLQIAARGGMGVKGGIIYTTTFPCELCSKKIYQSGINTIYYTEPYPNSIAEKLFLKDGINKIKLIQFEGVKSFSYFKLYKPNMDKKEAQILNEDYYKLF